jgi:hypothetical protein
MRLLAPLAAAVALTTLAASSASAEGHGSVVGVVRYASKAPARKAIQPTTDSQICSQQGLLDESLVVDAKSRGIRSVVAWVEGVQSALPPAAPPILDNKGCRYEPHVVVVQLGQKVTIRNSDKILHTSAAIKDGQAIFNFALPLQGQQRAKALKQPGLHQVVCDVHPWMTAWAMVLEGAPAATSDTSGRFRITGVPPGKHRLRLWHETLGERTLDVEVQAGGEVKVAVDWKP